MNTTHTAATNANILAAARRGTGDFYATRRELGRWCSEAIISAAQSVEVPARFTSGPLPTWRQPTAEEALFWLCSWASSERVREWGVAYAASRQAAIAELPEALAELGAAL